MNSIRLIVVAMLAADCVCPAQTANTVIWSPPTVGWWDDMPRPTVAKEMIATLSVASAPIVLEQTNLKDAQERFGGTFGSSGNAGDALRWLCLYGSDKGGAWILWLTSGEIDGPAIGGFQWRSLSTNDRPDHRCSRLPKNMGGIKLPIQLHLGMTEAEVQKLLGPPTVARDKTLFYCHEHRLVIRNEDFTVSNGVAIVLRKGVVWAIEVARTTGN